MARHSPIAFTLIELLVVVSIIGVLVGILIPALGLARTRSQDLQCLANGRSWAQGMFLYATDAGRFPNDGGNVSGTPDIASDAAKATFWINVVPPRLGDPPDWELASSNQPPMALQQSRGRIFRCPADPKTTGDRDGNGVTLPYVNAQNLPYYFDYIYGSKISGSNNLAPRLEQIAAPSRTVLIFERRADHSTRELPPVADVVAQTTPGSEPHLIYSDALRATYAAKSLAIYRGEWSTISARHNVGSNLAFCDGSARRLNYADLQMVTGSPDNRNTSTLIWAPLREIVY